MISLDWATPWAGLLALAPLLLAWLARRRQRRLNAWADPHLMPWAVAARGVRRPVTGWIDALAWLLLALAAAGPRLPLELPASVDSVPRHGLSLMVVLDVSASMAATDIAPSRLQRARLELADLAGRLRGERVGLIVYAGRAGLLLPPTEDPALFLRALEQAGPDLIEHPGSHVAAALALATSTLAGAQHRAVLLVGDAEAGSLTPAMAHPLRQAGIPLYLLSVATPGGAPIPLADGGYAEQDGNQVISRPDLDSARALARAAAGSHAEVDDGDADWRSLYDAGIARLPGDALPAARAQAWQMLFTWPLAAALTLFLWAHWPRALPLLLLAGLLAPPAEAGESASLNALRQGVAAWKQRDYSAAAHQFGTALLLADTVRERADALYNLGNAHYVLGHGQTAAEAWRAVLRLRPGDTRAAANLAQAERQLLQHRQASLAGDLRGRHGGLAEGEIDPNYNRGGIIQEFAPTPGSPINEGAHTAAGAGQHGATVSSPRIEADARRLQSGLKKLDLLDDRPRTLLRGQLKQDTPPDATPVELAPW